MRGATSSGPPPGFDVGKAKKPLPYEPVSGSGKKDITTTKITTETKNAATRVQAHGSAPSKPKPAAATVSSTKATSKAAALTSAEKTPIPDLEEASQEEEKKLTIWERVKHEAKHYWNGTKLLATEVRISTRLATKMALGYELTRREYRQLKRTTMDLMRLIPFLPFIIIPFGEAALPIVIKVFPGILPSTFEDKKSKEDKSRRLRAARKDVSKFLRSTLKETGLPIAKSTYQKEQFTTFFRKVRMTGEMPTTEDVIAVCQIFKDDMTLDNLSRPQLVSICRYLNLSSFGTDMMLRYLIRTRMRQLKEDDKAISYEGVDNLTTSELQTACASRGIKTYGMSPARLREDLQAWLDLRLKEKVPSTLLVLSNAYTYGQGKEPTNQIDALTNVLSSIPDELFHEMELEIRDAEGAATSEQRLEVLKEQEDLIEEENEQNEENATTGLATPRDDDNIDETQSEAHNTTTASAAETAEGTEAQETEAKIAVSPAEPKSKAEKESK